MLAVMLEAALHAPAPTCRTCVADGERERERGREVERERGREGERERGREGERERSEKE